MKVYAVQKKWTTNSKLFNSFEDARRYAMFLIMSEYKGVNYCGGFIDKIVDKGNKIILKTYIKDNETNKKRLITTFSRSIIEKEIEVD